MYACVCACACSCMYVCMYMCLLHTHAHAHAHMLSIACITCQAHHSRCSQQWLLQVRSGGPATNSGNSVPKVHSLHKVSTYRGLLKMGAILFTTCATVGPRPSHGPHSPIRPCPSIVNIPVRIRGRFPSAPPERQKSYLALSRPV